MLHRLHAEPVVRLIAAARVFRGRSGPRRADVTELPSAPPPVRRLHHPIRLRWHAHDRRQGMAAVQRRSWTVDRRTKSPSRPRVDRRSVRSLGRYRFRVDNRRLSLALVSDDCVPRRMILNDSTWRPQVTRGAAAARRIVRTGAPGAASCAQAASAKGSWPSFRGPDAAGVADGQHLPDRWNGKTGENILWKTAIPGLAHSSPIVWGDRIFVTCAISSRPSATFKPGLYGDGDASDDTSPHKFMLYAVDKRTGKIEWERIAFEGRAAQQAPHQVHLRERVAGHRRPHRGGVVRLAGRPRLRRERHPLWKVDLGRVDMGAYDIPSFEWGPASSPIIWNDLVLLQCDTQADSFLLALDVATGKTVWKTDREELPSWGTPTVISTPAGDELVTNASNFVRGYDPRSGKELWRLGGSSKITAPTAGAGARRRHRHERPAA